MQVEVALVYHIVIICCPQNRIIAVKLIFKIEQVAYGVAGVLGCSNQIAAGLAENDITLCYVLNTFENAEV